MADATIVGKEISEEAAADFRRRIETVDTSGLMDLMTDIFWEAFEFIGRKNPIRMDIEAAPRFKAVVEQFLKRDDIPENVVEVFLDVASSWKRPTEEKELKEPRYTDGMKWLVEQVASSPSLTVYLMTSYIGAFADLIWVDHLVLLFRFDSSESEQMVFDNNYTLWSKNMRRSLEVVRNWEGNDEQRHLISNVIGNMKWRIEKTADGFWEAYRYFLSVFEKNWDNLIWRHDFHPIFTELWGWSDQFAEHTYPFLRSLVEKERYLETKSVLEAATKFKDARFKELFDAYQKMG